MNKVTVFLGNFDSSLDLEEFVKEIYDEDGDSSSELLEELGIDYFDNQFLEVLFLGRDLQFDDFIDFSYSKSFINKLPLNYLNNNSIIMLYNYEHSDATPLKKLYFLGVFDYQ